MRKEIYYALHCIDNLRLSMITAWYMETGIQPNSFGDWAKLEGDRSKLSGWQLSLLEHSISLRRESMLKAMMEFRDMVLRNDHPINLESKELIKQMLFC
jgi:hypothetical protein